ncbi:tetratricopeptide repeat protein [Erythrobacter sp. SG61-1L]|uniref:tetratricopeptide repeat protein n=1 Tax=Erythrobacter sp. SG61-1L TaxID=1603897 RepID=UPI0006C93721|nr:tetratricopeptide repeat protein [Erythrobacter sp. SG61-1L]
MIAAAFLFPLLAQAAAPDIAEFSTYQIPPTLEQDRLTVCLDQARNDPSTAIVTASAWLGEALDAERSFPQQCLGIAYTRLLRWKAAEDAFLGARADVPETNPAQRGRFAAMAGNSALAEGRYDDALTDLGFASGDAASAGDAMLAGDIQIDRARALVGLGRAAEAAAALADARRDSPQNSDGWLLSATLSRRDGDLESAQAQIQTAAGLDPVNPAIGLEAGVIAALSGRDDAARKSWQSVVQTSPDSAEAQTARDYLAQLNEAPAPAAAATGADPANEGTGG